MVTTLGHLYRRRPDRFGVSWQVVPAVLGELMDDSDPERAQRVSRALLEMGKLETARLRAAYDG